MVELRRSKAPIHVLIVTADNMTGELLTSAFTRVRSSFEFTTVVGSSQDAIAKLKSHMPHVALICAELPGCGVQAGFKVLQSLRTSPHHSRRSLCFCSHPIPAMWSMPFAMARAASSIGAIH